MIKHVPTGLGHPYRTEPFERSPHFPAVNEKIVLRVCVLPNLPEVTLHVVEDGVTANYQMKNDGSASTKDLSEYGIPDKELFSNTHLEDAAIRSGEYGEWDSWSAEITMGAKEISYYFTTSDFKSESFLLKPSQWVPLNYVDSELKIIDEEWLIDTSGNAHKVSFSIEIQQSDHVIGFGERFHSIEQNGELVDAIVYEEYKGQGHRTYLPTPFAMVIGSNFAFHLQTSKNSRFDVAKKNPTKIYVEVDWDGKPGSLSLQKYSGNPSEMLHSYLDRGRGETRAK